METRNKSIRFVIYGCGFIANVHAAAIKSLPEAEQIESFVRALQGEDVELVDEHEGRKAVDIISRIYADK